MQVLSVGAAIPRFSFEQKVIPIQVVSLMEFAPDFVL
jgi:hypothetical protein